MVTGGEVKLWCLLIGGGCHAESVMDTFSSLLLRVSFSFLFLYHVPNKATHTRTSARSLFAEIPLKLSHKHIPLKLFYKHIPFSNGHISSANQEISHRDTIEQILLESIESYHINVSNLWISCSYV